MIEHHRIEIPRNPNKSESNDLLFITDGENLVVDAAASVRETKRYVLIKRYDIYLI